MRIHLNKRRNQSQGSTVALLQAAEQINLENIQAILQDSAARQNDAVMIPDSSPFSKDVRTIPIPNDFRMPNIGQYEGKTDPQDHLDTFKGQMELHEVLEPASCRCFVVALKGVTLRRFRKLASGSITSWH